MNSSESVLSLQNSESGPEVAQKSSSRHKRRMGKDHVDFWKSRLVKRTYEHGGKTHQVSGWQVRIGHLGEREWFNTERDNRETAALRAREFYQCLVANGWAAARKKFKPAPETIIPANRLTVGEFFTAVERTGHLSPRTFTNYQTCFRSIIAGIFKVKGEDSRFDYRSRDQEAGKSGNQLWREQIDGRLLESITPELVTDWQRAFVAKVGNSPVKTAAARRTANSYVRCSRSLFSRDLVEKIRDITLPAISPFHGVRLLEAGSMRYVSKIDAAGMIASARSELKDQDPETYKAFLLGLFLGLRKGEIDLAEWVMVDWANSRLNLTETDYLHLKTDGSAASVDIDAEVLAELAAFKASSTGRFIIHANGRKPRTNSARAYYRCAPVFKKLNAWLRGKGVGSNKPLHELRKEVGAIIATKDGIYAASRFLRHTDITTTARHYSDHKTRISSGLGSLLTVPLEGECKKAAC